MRIADGPQSRSIYKALMISYTDRDPKDFKPAGVYSFPGHLMGLVIIPISCSSSPVDHPINSDIFNNGNHINLHVYR